MPRFGEGGLQRNSQGPKATAQAQPVSPKYVRKYSKKLQPKPLQRPELVGKAGRPKKEIDMLLVERLARVQCTVAEIAAIMGVARITLDTNPEFVETYNRSAQGGKKSLRRKQFEIALKGNPSMLMFLGNHYLGQVPRMQSQLTGADGGPIKVEGTVVALNKLSDTELGQLQLLLEKAEVLPGDK